MIDQPLLKSSKMSQILVAPATSDDLSIVVSILSEAANWLEQKNMPLWPEELISPEIVSQDIASSLFYIATGRLGGWNLYASDRRFAVLARRSFRKFFIYPSVSGEEVLGWKVIVQRHDAMGSARMSKFG
jgi:hypothetical protein